MKKLNYVLAFSCLLILVALPSDAQLNQSGGPGSNVSINAGTNLIGKVGIDQTTPGTTNAISLAQIGTTTTATGNGVVGAGVQRVAIASDNTAFSVNASLSSALPAGTNLIGMIRMVPAACTQSTNFTNTTAQVATGAGTTVTTTTTCITAVYANNITNSAVTLRLADRQGSPVIWVGGNADFTIPANSNFRIPLEGITFTSGITAIAGTGSAINLQVNGLQ